MSRIATERNALRYPLDDILGSEAQVRVLRLLVHEAGESLGPSDAAKQAGLTPPGARKALARLEDLGMVERVGGGRMQRYGLREAEPLVDALRALFEAEQRLYDELIGRLRKALSDVGEARLIWVRALPGRLGDPLDLVVVAEAVSIGWLGEEIRARLLPIEKEFDLIVETSVFTRADAPSPAADALFILMNGSGEETAPRQPVRTHREADDRALLMAGAIAELIRSDPTLVKRALQHLNRLVHDPQGAATRDILEWRQLLETYSADRLRKLLVSDSSRARRLRQSSPFLAVLSPEERDHLTGLLSAKAG